MRRYSGAAVFFILFLLLGTRSFSQSVEFSLGGGHKAKFTPPSGWTKSTYDGEHCFTKPGNEVYLCIKSSWMRGRTAEKVLEEYIGNLPVISCTEKKHKTEKTYALWKECTVNVGPRKEGRIWMVITYKETMNALLVGVNLQTTDQSTLDTILKCLEGIVFTDPPPSN